MSFLYPLIVAFVLVFISELGDKTQLLVLSFSAKLKTFTILIGVALGTFLSHGLAILFGSTIGLLENPFLHTLMEIVTYSSFILFGILSFLPSKENRNENNKSSFIQRLTNFGIGYILIIAFCIAFGELGDKTLLASIGLGITYPFSKISLIIGAILGMVSSNSIAIIFGKFLSNRISENTMKKLSGILFILFGIIGFIKFLYFLNI